MKRLHILITRELRQMLVTPLAYVVLAVFWAASGFFFSFHSLYVSAVDMVTAFHNMSLLLMLMMPLITMRSFAEERQTNTLEMILSLPFSETQVVLAKYIAVLALLMVMLAGSGVAVAFLGVYASPDYGPIIGGYIGVFLLAAAFAAIGVLASSLCASQMLAAMLSWSALLMLWFIDLSGALAPQSMWVAISRYISFSVQYLDLIRGVLPVSAVIYFLSLSAACLALAVQLLAARRF